MDNFLPMQVGKATENLCSATANHRFLKKGHYFLVTYGLNPEACIPYKLRGRYQSTEICTIRKPKQSQQLCNGTAKQLIKTEQ